MKKELRFLSVLSFVAVFAVSCSVKQSPSAHNTSSPAFQKISEDSLLTLTEKRTFEYFWDGAEPHSGMARERYHMNGVYPQNDKNVVTTGGSGFGIMAILVGIKRHFITEQQGVDRLEKIVGFLEHADRFHGVFPHWIYGKTGKVKPFSQKDDGGDLVETSYLMQGLLTARQYLRKDGGRQEDSLATEIDSLWRTGDWHWNTRGGQNVLYWHWSPDYGWAMNFPIHGYNECLITYVLAASSPTHGVSAEVYHQGWARGGDIETNITTYGYTLTLKHNGAEKYGGPLFWEHYSYLGLDPHGLKDRYADYWTHNKNHVLINREWCVRNPKGYKGYGKDLWGLTSSYSLNGYAGHSPSNDLGVISPTAALSSFPYTPDYSMDVLKNLYYNYGQKTLGPYGFYDALSVDKSWYPQKYLAIDQGPIVVMIENYRSGMLWNLFMSSPEVQKGLKKLGFQSPHFN